MRGEVASSNRSNNFICLFYFLFYIVLNFIFIVMCHLFSLAFLLIIFVDVYHMNRVGHIMSAIDGRAACRLYEYSCRDS